MRQYSFDDDLSGYLYYDNLETVLNNTPWKYLWLKNYYLGDPTPLYVPTYLVKYLKYPVLEYLVKLRLYRLTTDIVYNVYNYQFNLSINLNGKNIKEVFGIDKTNFKLIQKLDLDFKQIELLIEMAKQKVKFNEEFLRWCIRYNIARSENITVPLKYMTSYKLTRYAINRSINENYTKMDHFLSDYWDYIYVWEFKNWFK